ncbi:MAG TPA: UvrD-helicase domain-containing protein [Polyangiaceae bacterium]|jgi:DNA helicase-2/ATP-dependent DNA helicase PcrA|nr:UvrD-helicase domain-containing protein [Polyangiaceae bacterium]
MISLLTGEDDEELPPEPEAEPAPDLNEPQASAVAHVEGPLLVFAGAGSGKTRVITYRIANLVARERVAPWRILAVTFTNKAAGEMRARLEKLCGAELAKALWVGTFHATCAKLLRLHGEPVGVKPNFVIYDSADQKAVVSRALKDLGLDEKRYPARAVLAHIHKHKQEGRGPEEAASHSYVDDVALRLYRTYEERLRAANAVDFEDLILLVARLLAETENTIEGDKIRRRFDYVLVDEFQDTNATQYRFLRELVRDHRNLCVVGDDDQSIYRWRGADVRNIRYFRRDYADAAVVKLEQNYRSSGRIVAAALGVIARSAEREPKELWTANDPGEFVHIVAARDERDEAAFVVDSVRHARADGTDLREIAVFYRVHAQSRVLEEAMRAANLPYQIIGGMKFYDRAEIKDALAYLRVLLNPGSDVDLLRVVNVPPRGIGQTTVDRLTAWATLNDTSIFDALARIDEIGDLGSAAKKKLVGFRELLATLRAESAIAPSEMVTRVLEETGYLKALEKEDTAESDARTENLQELASSMQDYEAEAEAAGEAPSLAGYLERVTLVSDVDSIPNPDGTPARDEGRVVLMTVHGAKGLEFEHVLLTGMEEQMFPYKGTDPGESEELEEERRLAYVAITRARRHLAMTHTQMRQIFGTTRWNRPSRFLSELPQGVADQRKTASMSSEVQFERYVDRGATSETARPWRHPQAGRESSPAPEPGSRYVDHDFFDDRTHHVTDMPLRRGSRVAHDRFGEGEVVRVTSVGEPAVVVSFPGWGEKKILARFLKPAS